MPSLDSIRVALAHDWLTGMRGGEKVLEVLCERFPNAPLYTLIHNPGTVSSIIESRTIHVSILDRFPGKTNRYRQFLPLMPGAVESLRVAPADLVISTSHAVIKGIRPPAGALHVCYCHTPMRYVWDQYDAYFGKGQAGPWTRAAMSVVAPYLRRWDVRTAGRVHYFIANSHNVARRIRRIYGRSADVVHAPVDTSRFPISTRDDGYYLIVSAMVPYKRLDLAIEAFRRLGERLVIAGSGPDRRRLELLAGTGVEFTGWVSDKALVDLYAGCRAVIFPGEEDFGIVPLEAMASGKPVVALGKGGVVETVVAEGPDRTGVFFGEQTVDALVDAVRKIQAISFDPAVMRRRAEQFGLSIFKSRLESVLQRYVDQGVPTQLG